MNNDKMSADPGDVIRRIKTEYEDTKKHLEVAVEPNLPDDSLIGTIWLNPNTNDMFVCNGKINGKAVWSKVSDRDSKVWV